MSGEHFPVDRWEPGDPVDEKHLADCKECRQNWEKMAFIRHQIAASVAVEPSPLFARRTTRRIMSNGTSVWFFLERTCRRIAPLAAAAVIVLAVLIFGYDRSEPQEEIMAQAFFETDETTDISLDDVIASLEEYPLEENIP
jgi:hypothetical protein